MSPIRLTLWDKAGWTGTLFLMSARLDDPPILALLFRERDSALRIFSALRNDLGQTDERNLLRVAVVRGIDAANTSWYRMSVGSNTDVGPKRPGSFVITAARILTLMPATSENLDGFLARYDRLGKYLLIPATVAERAQQPDVHLERGVLKTDLTVRNAWEIGLNDPDMATILSDDLPVLPEGGRAPVLELIEWKKERRNG
jgi:hypothetical protein